MKKDFFAGNEEVKTEWSSDLATLMRIDTGLIRCAEASMKDDLPAWFKWLRFLEREVIVKMSHKTKYKNGKRECSITLGDKNFCPRCYTNHLFNSLETNMNLYLNNRRDPELVSLLKKGLREVEVFLREFMDSKGMLLKEGRSALEKFQFG